VPATPRLYGELSPLQGNIELASLYRQGYAMPYGYFLCLRNTSSRVHLILPRRTMLVCLRRSPALPRLRRLLPGARS
jgi:hypothetical protein